MSPESDSTPDQPWGRVDDDGTVSVREVSAEDGTDTWRVVGQYPDGTPDEALAYFARKFSDLADKVRLLEQRQRGGGASASDLASAAKHLRAEIDGASAVGTSRIFWAVSMHFSKPSAPRPRPRPPLRRRP